MSRIPTSSPTPGISHPRDWVRWLSVASVAVAALGLFFGSDWFGRIKTAGPSTETVPGRSGSESSLRERSADITAYSFRTEPFVHPRLIETLVLAGEDVSSVEIPEAYNNNQHLYTDIQIKPRLNSRFAHFYSPPPSWPWVLSVDNIDLDGDTPSNSFWWQRPWRAYRYVGSTHTGLTVLRSTFSKGYALEEVWVVFVLIDAELGATYSAKREHGVLYPTVRERATIRMVGKFFLGDRWHGSVRVDGDDVVVRGGDLLDRCENGNAVTAYEAVELERIDGKACRQDGPMPHLMTPRIYKAPEFD